MPVEDRRARDLIAQLVCSHHYPCPGCSCSLGTAAGECWSCEAMLRFKNDLEAALLVGEGAPQPEWQPIETAPKDGREVLLRVAQRAGIPGKMLVGHYQPGGYCIEDHPAIDEGWYFWNGCLFDRASKPTHWMPLPDGPSLRSPAPPLETHDEHDPVTRQSPSEKAPGMGISASAAETAPRVRSIELLRKTLSMLTHFVWHRSTRPGEHLWSIPVDQERDFDCILSDAIDELERWRGQPLAADAEIPSPASGTATNSASDPSSSPVPRSEETPERTEKTNDVSRSPSDGCASATRSPRKPQPKGSRQ